MRRRTLPGIVLLFALATASAQSGSQISTVYDAAKNRTTVRLGPSQLSGAKDKYERLSFSVFYSYTGATKRVPENLSFELLTVVRSRKLDSDLYVVFVVDGEEMFLSSDRSAVLNPAPGKRWVGERLIFRLPYQTFLKFARAKDLAVRLDGVQFDFSPDHRYALRDLSRHIKN